MRRSTWRARPTIATLDEIRKHNAWIRANRRRRGFFWPGCPCCGDEVPTTCCSNKSLPATLNVTTSDVGGDCPCLDGLSFTITWDAAQSRWHNDFNPAGCTSGMGLGVAFGCISGGFQLRAGLCCTDCTGNIEFDDVYDCGAEECVDFGGGLSGPDSETCDPYEATFTSTFGNASDPCDDDCLGGFGGNDVEFTVTE